ncbi:hypothetical protein [Clostridium diolis]|uniref:hypothetical protein n=1 Tax=Clostridium diolis TaxID=223919 RepID=UPI003AF42238
MATKNIEIQDSTGNIYYPHTDAAIVKFGDSNVNATLSDMVYQTAGGSATAITLTIKGPLATGYPITFIASANNGGAATTINGKKLYKPGTTTSPNLIAGKAYTVWYNSISDCFFIKASAEGNTVTSHVLAGDTFSNDTDTGIAGTMPNITADQTAANITQSGTNVSFLVQKGYWDGTKKLNAAATAIDADCITGNIKAGVNIMGVTGKSSVVDTADATVVANHMLSGETAYKNGAKVIGTMVDKGQYSLQCVSATIWSDRVYHRIPEGYYHGGNYDTNGGVAESYLPFTDLSNLLGLTADKIVSGNTVCGVAGSVVVPNTPPNAKITTGSYVMVKSNGEYNSPSSGGSWAGSYYFHSILPISYPLYFIAFDATKDSTTCYVSGKGISGVLYCKRSVLGDGTVRYYSFSQTSEPNGISVQNGGHVLVKYNIFNDNDVMQYTIIDY